MKSVKRDASSKAWKKSPKVSKKPGKTGKKPAKKSSKVVARDLAVSAMRRVPMPAGSYAPRAGSLAAAVLYVLYVEKARELKVSSVQKLVKDLSWAPRGKFSLRVATVLGQLRTAGLIRNGAPAHLQIKDQGGCGPRLRKTWQWNPVA